MATEEQIRKAIMKVAGDPESGVIADLADDIARAIVELDTPAKEVRVVIAKETR